MQQSQTVQQFVSRPGYPDIRLMSYPELLNHRSQVRASKNLAYTTSNVQGPLQARLDEIDQQLVHLRWFEVTYLADVRCVADVRRGITGFLFGYKCVHDVALIVSELFTNSVRHSASSRDEHGTVIVRAEARRQSVRVEVQDAGGPWLGPVRADARPVPPERESGRGLQVVSSLSEAWDIKVLDCDDAGHVSTQRIVWASIPEPEDLKNPLLPGS